MEVESEAGSELVSQGPIAEGLPSETVSADVSMVGAPASPFINMPVSDTAQGPLQLGADGVAADPSLPYELYAVLVHQGSALFGHYYALIQDVSASEWHEFNDSSVKPIKASELKRAVGGESGGAWGSGPTAYMLLYRKMANAADVPDTSAAAPLQTDGGAAATPGATLGAWAAVHGPTLKSDAVEPKTALEYSGAGVSRAVEDGAETKRLRLSPPQDVADMAEAAADPDDDNPYARMEF